jgi:hypothetical protein
LATATAPATSGRPAPTRDHRAADGATRATDHRPVIRNVIIHIANEQPLLADLYDMPTSSDVSLVCTNLRMLDGKKPIFIEHQGSVFVFPYLTIRFIEILAGQATGVSDAVEPEPERAAEPAPADDGPPEPDLELDEDFLRRIREV